MVTQVLTPLFTVDAALRITEWTQKEQHPKALEHYWSAYRSDASSSRYAPKTFVEGVRRARAHLAISGHAHESVEMIANCLLHLAERTGLRKPVSHPNGKLFCPSLVRSY